MDKFKVAIRMIKTAITQQIFKNHESVNSQLTKKSMLCDIKCQITTKYRRMLREVLSNLKPKGDDAYEEFSKHHFTRAGHAIAATKKAEKEGKIKGQ